MIKTSSLWYKLGIMTALFCELVWAHDIDKQKADLEGTHVISTTADRLKNIGDMGEVPMADRTKLLNDIDTAFPLACAERDAHLQRYVSTIIECVDALTSADFGDRATQDAVCQKMVLDCLTFADKLDISFEFRLVSQLRLGPSRNINDYGKPVLAREWATLRNRILEYRLHLWRRNADLIDPTWDSKDAAVISAAPFDGESGMAPEQIVDPEERFQYEASIKANRLKADRNSQQRAAREGRNDYLPRLQEAIQDLYTMGPVSQDDLDTLAAYLRIYVSDEKLRAELFQVAEAASQKTKSDNEPKAAEGQ